MKKYVVFFLCFWMLHPCYSQPFQKLMHQGGLLDNLAISILLAKCSIFGNDSWEDPLGAQIGIETKLMEIDENSSVNAGIGISFQGAAYSESYDFDDYYGLSLKGAFAEEYSGKVSLTYLVVPVLYKYQTEGGFYGEIGLQPGILLSAKDKVDGEDSYDYKDYVKGFDLGVPFGAGYQVNEQLSVGARAVVGITNLDNAGSEKADHNLMIGVLVRYKIASSGSR